MADRFRAGDHVRVSEHESGMALLDVRHGALYSANATGKRIWQRMQLGDSVVDIIDELRACYGISSAMAERGVRAFIASLEQAGFVEPAGGADR